MGNKDQPIRERTTMLSDTMLIAFLKVRGHTAIPWIQVDENGNYDPRNPRIEFDVIGEEKELEESMQLYHGNEPVGIQDYVRSLREVKSAIYDMKKIGQGKR